MAAHIMDALARYSYVDVYKYGDGSNVDLTTPVCVTAFSRELTSINTLWGFMLAGGLHGFVLLFDLDNEYAKGMIQKTEDYIKAQNEKMAVCLQAIRDYVAECEANGSKVVKKRLAERLGLGYDYVREVWQLFDKERAGG